MAESPMAVPVSASLPERCIRGPELTDAETISAVLQMTDAAALAAYLEGVHMLIRAHSILTAQAHLPQLRQTRTFLLHRLRSLERQDRSAFDAGLAAYDATRVEVASTNHPTGEKWGTHADDT